MKQRLTYVVKDPDNFSPNQLIVSIEDLLIKNVDAAKEHRITLGLDELPDEISKIFKQWHETHIRWSSPKSSTLTPPFTSRVSPGLHIFFTPLDNTPADALCEQLRLFNVHEKCQSSYDEAIKFPILSERFSMSATSQYYTYLDSIEYFVQKILPELKLETLSLLMHGYQDGEGLSYLDIDYDTISRAVVLNFGWADAPSGKGWNEGIIRHPKDSTVEIGVLSHEPNSDPEDIQFGGFLVVLGDDDHPKPARFQTPTRHYPLLLPSTSTSASPKPHPLTYTTSFSRPTGLHPTLILSFPSQHLTPPNPTCKLHTHLTLPSYLFIDKYQFTDPLFLSSKKLKSLRSLAGATDLEAPDWVVKEWGSAALFELSHPPFHPDSSTSTSTSTSTSISNSNTAPWNISIPLHLRYLPAAPRSHTRVPVPWPVVFWACRADEGAKMAANPFDRTNLGYEGLFGPKTRFMHVEPQVSGRKGDGAEGGELVEYIDVPVLDTRGTKYVEVGTMGIVFLGFFSLCWVLFRKRDGEAERRSAEKKKQ